MREESMKKEENVKPPKATSIVFHTEPEKDKTKTVVTNEGEPKYLKDQIPIKISHYSIHYERGQIIRRDERGFLLSRRDATPEEKAKYEQNER